MGKTVYGPLVWTTTGTIAIIPLVRVGVSPSEVTGLESTSQNQVLGQNSASRVGESHYRDVNVTFEHDTVLSDTAFNEFRFQFARRGLSLAILHPKAEAILG